MSDTDTSDIENISFKKRKNGYTYYGGAANNMLSSSTSSVKLILTVFFISITFLLIGFGVGYYFGFDNLLSLQSSSNSPIPDAYIPDPYIADENIADSNIPDVSDINIDDPFKIFIHSGIRYGGDYGYDTINNPVNSDESITRRLTEGIHDDDDDGDLLKKEEQCSNRRCCHPVNGISDEEGKQCYNLNLNECCKLEAKDICDWNCQRDVPNVRADHVVRPGRKRNKLCYGHSKQNGIFMGDRVLDAPPDSGSPKNVTDLEERDGVQIIDECGDVFISLIDDETAENEMLNDGNTDQEEQPEENCDDDEYEYDDDDDEGERRRMKIIGRDDRERQRSRRHPQNKLGLITFSGGHICSGTKVSRKHILTAGHCCHSGGRSGSFHKNWRWYPGPITKSSVRNGIKLRNAKVFNAWIRSKNRDYDICWLTLSKPYSGYLGYGYSNSISSRTSFDFWGYPGDKYFNAKKRDYIKWGDSNCKPNTSVLKNQLRYTCDTAGGMSGSGLYKSNNKVYCIHTFGVTNRFNGCSRITPDKYKTMLDTMRADKGW